MKRIICLLPLVFLISCSTTEHSADNSFEFKTRGLANSSLDDFSSEHLIAHYGLSKNSRSRVFKEFKIKLSPYGGMISFKSSTVPIIDNKGKELENEMDCKPSDDNTEWLCRSGCEGGDLVVRFKRGVKLSHIKVDPFKIILCAGDEPYRNLKLEARSTHDFILKNVSLEK